MKKKRKRRSAASVSSFSRQLHTRDEVDALVDRRRAQAAARRSGTVNAQPEGDERQRLIEDFLNDPDNEFVDCPRPQNTRLRLSECRRRKRESRNAFCEPRSLCFEPDYSSENMLTSYWFCRSCPGR